MATCSSKWTVNGQRHSPKFLLRSGRAETCHQHIATCLTEVSQNIAQ